jgi:predicted phage tail protein
MPNDPDTIKRAVKEALDDKAIQDLGHQLTGLSTQMTEGFSKITTRQDIANGKLMKHEAKISVLEKGEEEINRRTTFWQRNQDKIVWGIVGTFLMLFYYLLTNNGFPAFLN